MSTSAQLRLAQVLIWLTPAFWAINYLVARKAPGVIGPYALAFGRWLFAGTLLALATRAELWRQRRAILHAWRQYLALGATGMLVCGAWVYQAARTTGAMNISLIYSAAPVLIALGAVFWLGERITRAQVFGAMLALAGVLHVVLKGQWIALGSVQWVAGDGWMVLAMTSWALYALLQKHWPSALSPLARLAVTCFAGILTLLPFTLWELGRPEHPAWSAQAGLLVATVALLPGVAAYSIYGWAQRLLGASRVAVTLYLGPLWAALVAYFALGEPLATYHLGGAVLILPGVFWATRRAAPMSSDAVPLSRA